MNNQPLTAEEIQEARRILERLVNDGMVDEKSIPAYGTVIEDLFIAVSEMEEEG